MNSYTKIGLVVTVIFSFTAYILSILGATDVVSMTSVRPVIFILGGLSIALGMAIGLGNIFISDSKR